MFQAYWPKTLSDKFAFSFMLFIIPYIATYQWMFMLPKYYGAYSYYYCVHLCCGLYLLMNVTGNLFLLITKDSSICGRILFQNDDSKSQLLWRNCSVCECLVPPRAFHCHICNVCFLKRDHHCMFTGRCVGHDNHRYFLLMVTYISIAALYAGCFNLPYLLEIHGGVTGTSIFRIGIPFMAFILGLSTWIEALIALTCMICLLGGCLTGALAVYHWQLVLKNQTTYEKHKQMNDFDLGSVKNLQACLGKRWFFAWICPWIPSILPSDGIKFVSKSGHVLVETTKRR